MRLFSGNSVHQSKEKWHWRLHFKQLMRRNEQPAMKIQIISGFERSKRGARNAKALEALSTRVDEFMPPCQRGLCMPVFYGVLASSLQTVFPASVEHGNPVTHQSFSDTATTRISQATTQILLAFQVSCLYFSIGDLAIHQTDGIADEIWPPFPARR